MEPIPIKAPSLGVRPDLDPEDVDDASLVQAENMIARNGDFQVRPGFSAIANDIGERPMAYINYDHADGNTRAVQGTDRGWRRLAGALWSNITGTPLTGTPEDQIVFRTFSKAAVTWLLGTNGANDLKKWDGSSATYLSAGGSPPRARCMCVVFDRIVLGNLLSGGTISPLAIDVSANKDFDAGWGTELVALLADTEGPIKAMQEMGTLNAAILKSDSVYMLIAQGGAVPFRIQWVKSGITGPASALLSAKLSTGAIAMAGNDGLVSVFDGSNVQSLPYAIQRQIVRTANLEKMNRGWMLYDTDRRELYIIYPLIGSDEHNGGVMINMGTMAVYPLRFPVHSMSAGGRIATTSGLTIGDLVGPIGSITNTIGSLATTTVLRRMVMGDVDGQTYQEMGSTDDGTAIPFFWDTPVRGQAERFRTINGIRHRFKPTATSQQVSIAVGRRNEGGDIAYDTGKVIDLSTAGRKTTSHRTSAEYFSLRFQGNATKEVVYQGSSIDLKIRGRR